ncbi:hypothetical protein [Plesiomonas shigelloides]|uniref:hypothetical protein n=1 Tax=Plesiomonas shigelloides TaxID=703 RepID=UPI0012614678|nr:hypothetical protein [Plesiomonas shigelloides]KAB7665966.1 hypothetical protein GBN25_05640 [Plesiomonas shigelloides]
MVERDSTKKCFFCDMRSADGSWVGSSGQLNVCSPCSVSILPQLIADAVFGGLPPHVTNRESSHSAVSYVNDKLETVKSKYFEALAKASLTESYSLSDDEIKLRESKIISE